jgi:heme a synthase
MPPWAPGRPISVTSPASGRAERTIALWLLACCAMIFMMVLIGGATRLTESGLSITEWQPITGAIPPLSEADWTREFERYQAIPQYQAIHAGMTLGEFKTIFLWEYVHRLWGRLIGVVFLGPFLWFLWRRSIARSLAPKLAAIFLLGGLQGALGWYMVRSGLQDRIEVSQYRLAAHLAAALLIYLVTLWVALDLLPPAVSVPSGSPARLRRAISAVLGLAFITVLAGAFVAGLRGGLVYNTFPLMNGYLVAPEYTQLSPWYLTPFENPVAAQFDHRVLAEVTWLAVWALWLYARRLAPVLPLRRALDAVLLIANLQVVLGVATLLLVVPIPLALLHQAGALLLLTALLVARYQAQRLAPVTSAAV